MKGILVRDLCKRFGSVAALDRVGLAVEPGDVAALVGPNGSGKSTLLRILATVVLPDTGTASIAGHDVVLAGQDARAHTGLVIGDDRTWYWRLTARENLDFFGALYGFSSEERAERANKLLEAHGLADAVDRPVAEYSTGMRARLALARALFSEPAVLLLDEPTRSIDLEAAQAFREHLAALTAARATTVLLATHDLEDVRSLADRTYLLNAGRVVASADADGVEGLAAHLAAGTVP